MALHVGTPLGSVPPQRSQPPTSYDLGEHEMLAKQFHEVRFLGAGPDGTALAAARRDGGAEVELRFVQEHAQTDELLERWSRYQLLDHPHVISLQQVEYANGEWCAVLDSAQLGTLEQALAQLWTPEASLRLLEQLASALAAAHDIGLWHGNLSPGSVRLDPRRGARLEFSGVSVWSEGSAAQRWQERDASDDVQQLAELAERLLGGPETARKRLP